MNSQKAFMKSFIRNNLASIAHRLLRVGSTLVCLMSLAGTLQAQENDTLRQTKEYFLAVTDKLREIYEKGEEIDSLKHRLDSAQAALNKKYLKYIKRLDSLKTVLPKMPTKLDSSVKRLLNEFIEAHARVSTNIIQNASNLKQDLLMNASKKQQGTLNELKNKMNEQWKGGAWWTFLVAVVLLVIEVIKSIYKLFGKIKSKKQANRTDDEMDNTQTFSKQEENNLGQKRNESTQKSTPSTHSGIRYGGVKGIDETQQREIKNLIEEIEEQSDKMTSMQVQRFKNIQTNYHNFLQNSGGQSIQNSDGERVQKIISSLNTLLSELNFPETTHKPKETLSTIKNQEQPTNTNNQTKPDSSAPVKTKYSVFSKDKNGFQEHQFLETPDRKAAFALTLDKETGTFEVQKQEPSLHVVAINHYRDYLESTCQYNKLPKKGIHKTIVNIEAGKLRKNGDLWIVEEKAKIRFE